MYDDILVPTDGSDGTDQTLDHAIEIAENHDATVHAISVMDQRVYLAADDDERPEIKGRLEGDAKEAIEDVTERLAETDLELETAIVDGTPYKEILNYGDDHDIDLVTIGTHGRTGRDRLENLGSVTERVVREADRTVLVVSIGD
jgi:nucleotide-binding universal stress UspA family protein